VVKGFAVLVVVAVMVVGACGGDGNDETDADGGTTDATAQRDSDDNGDQTGSSGETGRPETPDGEGYPDQVRRNFMNACAAQPNATQAQCECTFDEISKTVPVEEFVAYDQAIRRDPATSPPIWIEAAVTACS
jgi:hypothetical protein